MKDMSCFTPGGLQAVDQLLAHGLDAHAHFGQFFFPLGAQLGVFSTMATTVPPWWAGCCSWCGSRS
jgi:hypothetical protein